jgi:uncharacterized protein
MVPWVAGRQPLLCGAIAFAALSLLMRVDPASAASFDCAKAQSPMEKHICADPKLSAADETLAAAYKKVLDALSDDAAAKVRKGQREWLKFVRTVCPPNKGMVDCLAETLTERQAALEKSVVKAGDILVYAVETFDAHAPKDKANAGGQFATTHIAYPQIDKPATDGMRQWNAWIATRAQKSSIADGGDDQLDMTYDIHLVLPQLISGDLVVSDYPLGAAHPTAAVTPFKWLVAEGRELRADDLFDKTKPWQKTLSDACIKAFTDFDNPADFCAADKLNIEAWTIEATGIGLQFQEYEIGPYAAGAPKEIIPWTDLKAVLVGRPPFAIPPTALPPT